MLAWRVMLSNLNMGKPFQTTARQPGRPEEAGGGSLEGSRAEGWGEVQVSR